MSPLHVCIIVPFSFLFSLYGLYNFVEKHYVCITFSFHNFEIREVCLFMCTITLFKEKKKGSIWENHRLHQRHKKGNVSVITKESRKIKLQI